MAIVTGDLSVAMYSNAPLNKWTNWGQEKWLVQGNKASQEQSWDTYFYLLTSSSALFPRKLGACHQMITASQEWCTHRWLYVLYFLWSDFKMDFSSSFKIFTLGVRGLCTLSLREVRQQGGTCSSNSELCRTNTPHSSSRGCGLSRAQRTVDWRDMNSNPQSLEWPYRVMRG